MEPDLHGEAVREQVEVPAEGAVVVAGWEERVLALDPAVVVSAPTAGQVFPTR